MRVVPLHVTVPILWDKQNKAIVNNESSEIIRIFNDGFNELTGNSLDYYPKDLQGRIDELNELIYSNVNNGVYLSGFAKGQKAYEEAVLNLFKTLDLLEERLEGQDFLVGNQLTEADLRLIPTLLRFDPVYVTHFKCNLKRITDYPHLSRYVKRLYRVPGVRETVDFHHIKDHYYQSHETLNPFGLVPIGPELNFD